MLDFLIGPKARGPALIAGEPNEQLKKLWARQKKAREYAERIEDAVTEAGFDAQMLDDLPATYVAAALILGVKS